uniref:Uncharacterized protein n=1 Tax=Anser brachyrhynchus TaxID=132585 RepID=A0A8B9CY53_9AVES
MILGSWDSVPGPEVPGLETPGLQVPGPEVLGPEALAPPRPAGPSPGGAPSSGLRSRPGPAAAARGRAAARPLRARNSGTRPRPPPGGERGRSGPGPAGMARDPAFVLRYLAEVEELAEDVLAARQQIVDLDVKRNRNREALRALHKDPEPDGEAGPRALPGAGGEHREPGSLLSPFLSLPPPRRKSHGVLREHVRRAPEVPHQGDDAEGYGGPDKVGDGQSDASVRRWVLEEPRNAYRVWLLPSPRCPGHGPRARFGSRLPGARCLRASGAEVGPGGSGTWLEKGPTCPQVCASAPSVPQVVCCFCANPRAPSPPYPCPSFLRSGTSG